MKLILILFFIYFHYSIFSDTETNELKDSAGNTVDVEITDDLQGLDREFYTTYFLMNPLEYEKKESKTKREENILRVFKREIGFRDPYNKSILEDFNISNVKIVRVTKDNHYIKKFKKRANHIRLTEYMYIAKFKNYICMIFYEANPSKYYITPTFVELVFPRKLLLDTE